MSARYLEPERWHSGSELQQPEHKDREEGGDRERGHTAGSEDTQQGADGAKLVELKSSLTVLFAT